jgi:uncharacterized protein
MDTALLLANILNPPVLFFFLGMGAVALRSDLDLPQPLPKFFALYLLLALGFKGGVELRASGVDVYVAICLTAAIAMALLVPLYAYVWLRRKLDAVNAAAIAATYGSISAVTFITATSFLAQQNIPFGGHMVAAMALMESPAIIVGVLLARRFREAAIAATPAAGIHTLPSAAIHTGALWREAFFNGSVVVLIGSLLIGVLTGEAGAAALEPFTGAIFKGMLCIFLLDMGLVSARRLGGLKKLGAFPLRFSVGLPLVNAVIGLAIAYALGFTRGDALLFTVLCASASYIAVPAALRLALPEANPGVYVTMSLALTFPFNVAIGIPLYMGAINWLWR